MNALKKEFLQIFLLQVALVLFLWLVGAYYVYAEEVNYTCGVTYTYYEESATKTHTIVGFYSTQAEAVAARNAGSPCSECAPAAENSALQYATMADPAKWRFAYRTCWRDCDWVYGGWDMVMYAWDYAGDGSCSEPLIPPDADADGLPDSIDPYPNDPTDFTWHTFSYCKDISGDTVWQYVITSRGTELEMGDHESCASYDIINMNPAQHSSSEYADLFSEGGYDPSSVTGADSLAGTSWTSPDVGSGTGFTSGVDDSGSVTDSDRLSAIVGNTKASADNVARLGDYMEGLGNQIDSLNKNLASGIPVYGDTGEASGTDMSETNAKLDTIAGKLTGDGTGESELSGFDVGSHYGSMPGAVGEGGEGETLSETPIEEQGWFSDFVANNPMKNALSNSGIVADSGACSINADLGRLGMHQLDICDLGPGLGTAGILLLSITSLWGLVVVVRS